MINEVDDTDIIENVEPSGDGGIVTNDLEEAGELLPKGAGVLDGQCQEKASISAAEERYLNERDSETSGGGRIYSEENAQTRNLTKRKIPETQTTPITKNNIESKKKGRKVGGQHEMVTRSTNQAKRIDDNVPQ